MSPEDKHAPVSVRLSLVSHTNVGKTTLARTLLRQDVGEVRDAAHVTELAEQHVLIETAQGQSLVLWDTPGFGDSVRLLRRLERSGNPLGWFLAAVWDRYTDRPFWSSQQAVRNVRDQADVVLYLVNAAEDPATAGYVDPEMRILGWIGKPVLVLLNQLGPPRPADQDAADEDAWRGKLASHEVVRGVLAFDAFARCWVQEGVLLEAIGAALDGEAALAFPALDGAWRKRNEEVFRRSLSVLARQLATSACDRATVPTRSVGEAALRWISQLTSGDPRDPALDRAMAALAERADQGVRDSTDQLILLHGLAGSAGPEILRRVGSDFDVQKAADPGRAGVIGAVLSGALGGLAADLAAGGLTFGAGALLGGVLGAAGMQGLTRMYNAARGSGSTIVQWSPAFMTARVTAAILRYLAVAHYGRGRGEYVQGESPGHWVAVVGDAVNAASGRLAGLWLAAPEGPAPAWLAAQLERELGSCAAEVLQRLYPGAPAATVAASVQDPGDPVSPR